jgi:GrpB-like predicted nucleotidyltransferase (UPF0157 family)
MQLIFVEGVSGVGKTTTAWKLCEKLREYGFPADCFLEGDIANPIDFYGTAYFTHDEYADLLDNYTEYVEEIQSKTIVAGDIRLVRYYNRETPLFPEPLLDMFRKHEFCWKPGNLVPISEYTRVYKAACEQFVQNESKHPDFLIFDGSLFHHPINDMTRNYGASLDQIAQHINTLIETVNQLHPQVIYLSSENVAERLRKARISRKETIPSTEQIRFWEQRKRMDCAVMKRLSIPCSIFDISQEDWSYLMEELVNRILETDAERRARIYPVILSEYNPEWPEWYAEEKTNLERLLGNRIVRIQHIGSTAVPGLTAKPTIDILIEAATNIDIEDLIAPMPAGEYICLRREGNSLSEHDRVMFLKGYTDTGFADKVFHIHVRNHGDWDECHFRDYLITHPETATEYAELKCRLFKDYEHDRDGYTAAKGDFIKEVTKKAKERA